MIDLIDGMPSAAETWEATFTEDALFACDFSFVHSLVVHVTLCAREPPGRGEGQMEPLPPWRLSIHKRCLKLGLLQRGLCTARGSLCATWPQSYLVFVV